MGTISVSLPTDGTTADVSDYNTPITTIVNAINGGLDNDNIAANAAISGTKLAADSIDLEAKASADTGWRHVTDSWTYASATTITVPSDATTKYSVGDRIRLVQTTTKYFYIVAVASTTLTISGGADYTLVNAAISSTYYSKAASPVGFPDFFDYEGSPTGFSSTTTSIQRFKMNGREVRVSVAIVGTSNSTGFTFSAPITSKTLVNKTWVGLGLGADNGSGLTTVVRAVLPSNSSTITLGPSPGSVTWTASNTKEAALDLVYEI